ncbi:hypothetical protein [Parafrigoribacterium humi]|uniref:hypothetical protein n=1 Tax=Parafrigoribacterium humi TaxID=3144664 RepID=UPI0032EC0A1F
MARRHDHQNYAVRVSPRSSLVRTGVLSYVLLSLPLFGALYFLGAPRGTWPIALLVHVITIVGALASYNIYRRIFIGVTQTEVHERSVLGGTTVTPLKQIRSASLVSTYRSASTETTEQLILCDEHKQRLVRMRGAFWTTSSMREVAAATRVPLEESTDPITAQVFFQEYPGSAYWFENRPVITGIAIVVTLGAMLGLVLGLMALMGIPTGNPL